MISYFRKIQRLSVASKRFLLIFIDYILVTFAIFLSQIIILGYVQISTLNLIFIGMLFVLLLNLLGFYKDIFSETDISIVFNKLVLSSILSNSIIIFIADSGIAIFVCSFSLSTVSIISYRSFFKNFFLKNKDSGRKIGIYGAGAAGNMLYSALSKSKDYEICFFIDDDKSLIGRSTGGVPIISSNKLESYSSRMNVKEIALAIPSISNAKKINIIEKLSFMDLKITKVPPLEDIILGKRSVDSLTDFTINDLLGRDVIYPKRHLLQKSISSNDVILITGAGGSIGSELSAQIFNLNPKKIILLDVSEYALYEIERKLESKQAKCEVISVIGSILDRNLLDFLHKQHNINFIFHAAAYKHVPMVEKNILQAIKNNVLGTHALVEFAQRSNIHKFVFISTDKAVRPTNVMGATKRLCELILQANDSENKKNKNKRTIYSMVRFGNVLGSSGSVVPLFLEQIKSGGPVTVTHKDITRYFMSIPEAAALVIQSTSMTSGGEVFVLDMGEPIRIYDLAKLMIKLSGLSIKKENLGGDIEVIFTGLRQGEKLYEELLIGKNVSKTSHEKIMCANEDFLSFETITKLIDELKNAIKKDDEKHALDILYKNLDDFTHLNK